MKQVLYKLTAMGLLAASLLAGWLWWDYSAFLDNPLRLPEAGLELRVEPGQTLTGVARRLGREGVLEHPGYLLWHARWRGRTTIQAGEYRLAPGTTPVRLLEQLTRGEVIQYSLTVVEGWTFRQLMEAVNAHEALDHTLGEADAATVMARLGRPGEHPEGRFLPDTYHFPRGTTDVEFLRRAYRAMERVLAEEWEQRAVGLPLRTPYEALILASIVEKETGLASERAAIAGVFIRRLQRGMRLQSDPTVIYGLGARFDGNLRRADLRRDTPYNTYRRRGLPPTPIALPGRAAIHATLHPEEGDAVYFVSRGDGSHHFSATLEEHNEAVIRYQLKGRRRAFSSYPPRKDAAP